MSLRTMLGPRLNLNSLVEPSPFCKFSIPDQARRLNGSRLFGTYAPRSTPSRFPRRYRTTQSLSRREGDAQETSTAIRRQRPVWRAKCRTDGSRCPLAGRREKIRQHENRRQGEEIALKNIAHKRAVVFFRAWTRGRAWISLRDGALEKGEQGGGRSRDARLGWLFARPAGSILAEKRDFRGSRQRATA